MAVRRRLEMDERRAQLLELGLEIFGEKSYEEISIDEIARRAGVSKGLLYHYFSNKRDFYVACVRAGAARFDEAIVPDPDLPPLLRAYQGLGRYLDFVEARAEAYQALLSSGIGVDPEIAEIVNASRRRIVDRMLEDSGLENPTPALRTLARAWIGAVEAASLDWLANRSMKREQLVDMLVSMLMATVSALFDEQMAEGETNPDEIL